MDNSFGTYSETDSSEMLNRLLKEVGTPQTTIIDKLLRNVLDNQDY